MTNATQRMEVLRKLAESGCRVRTILLSGAIEGEQISRAAVLNPPPPNMVRTVADVIDSMESDITVFLRLQSLSRLQEMEADDIGIELAACAGIAPDSIVSFYTKLTRAGAGQSLFDTHGSPQQRELFVKSMANYALSLYEASLRSHSRSSYSFVRASN